jgi:hypothetical protein
MSTRIFRFIGTPFSQTSALELTINFCDQTIFEGIVSTELGLRDSFARDFNNYAREIANCEISRQLTGFLPLQIQVRGGILAFGTVLANYTYGYEDAWSPPSQAFNSLCYGKDSKKNININGMSHVVDNTTAWYFRLLHKDTLTCDIYYPPEHSIEALPSGYAMNYNLRGPDPLDL